MCAKDVAVRKATYAAIGVLAGWVGLGLSSSLCLGDGEIVAWGLNEGGQCNVPEPNTGFLAIATGATHSLGLRADGSIAAWGDNGGGQCNVPEPNTDFVAMVGGSGHSLGLKSDGSIVPWGANGYGQCDVPEPNTDFVAVASGAIHSLGLKSDSSIVAWGYNNHGECNVPEPNTGFVSVMAGAAHNLGLKSDGSIVTWGLNNHGQCNVPEPNTGFVAMDGGDYHSLGLQADGSIVAWGHDGDGRCDVPEPNTDFVAVAAGYSHSLGLKIDGSIVAWGSNSWGQCNVPEPNTGFSAISSTPHPAHSLGLKGSYIFGLLLTSSPVQIGGDNEIISFSAEAQNHGLADDTYDVSVTGVPASWSYSYTTPAGTFSGPSTMPLVSGGTAPIAIDVDSQGNSGSATMQLRLVSQGDPRQSRRIFFTKLNGEQVLVVDDDGGATREIPVTTTLAAIGRSYCVYDMAWGPLAVEDLWDAGQAVIWLTGATSLSLDAAERALISDYLTAGGRLLLTGQKIGYDLADPMSPYFSSETILWFINTLHCLYIGSSSAIYTLTGVAGDPLGDGLGFGIQQAGPYGQASPDVIGPSSGTTFLNYQGMPTWFGGVHFTDGNQYLVYTSFGLEGIIESSQRELLLSRVLDWFGVITGAPGLEALPVTLSLAPIAPNPILFPARITYRLTSAGRVGLRIFDVGGRLVRTLVDEHESATDHRHEWNGRDEVGRAVPNGVYFYRLDAGGQSVAERLVVVR